MINKQFWQRITALLLCLCLCTGVLPAMRSISFAEAEDTGWQYRICEDGYAEVTGYTGTRTALTIPETLGGAWVVRVAQGALSHLDARSIQVPETISQIPAGSLPAQAAVHAVNGSCAHQAALTEGKAFVNLSEYDLFDDILDLSDMPQAFFSVTGDQLTISDPYARLIQPGMRLFLPAMSGYAHGLPVQVIDVLNAGSAAQVTFRELGFTDTVETYSVENLLLTPDYSRTEILADGFTMLSTAPRGMGIGNETVFGIDFQAPNGFGISGSLTMDVSYTVDLDMEWMKINGFSYEGSETYKFDIKFSQISESVNTGTLNDKITFARVPLASTGLVSAWLEAALVFRAEGSVSVEYTVVFNETCTWKKGDAAPKFTHSKSGTDGVVNLAVGMGAEVQASLTMSVGFKTGNLALDFAQLTASLGGQIKVESNTLTPDCADVSLQVKAGLTLKLGILNSGSPQLALSLKLLEATWTIKKWHAETLDGPVEWMENCTQLCNIALCTFSEEDDLETIPALRGTSVSLPTPKRNGYTFTGWHLDSDCTQLIEGDLMVRESITVYAGWVANTPTPPPTATPTPAPTPTLIPPTPVPTNSLEDLDYLVYKIENNEVTITDYKNNPYSLVIPAFIEGLPVTTIGNYAFEDCLTLTSVKIPSTVKTIGYMAFQDCNSLTSLTLSEGIKTIDSYAFNFCGMERLDLPDSIESLGAASFGNNDHLWYVELPVSLKSTNATYSAFSGCDGLTNVSVPSGMVHLPANTFRSMDSITNVSLPGSLRSIGSRAFSNCDGLEYISFPSGLTELGVESFSSCDKLKRIDVPAGVQVIPQHCFSGCTMLESVTLHEGLREIELCGLYGSKMLETLHLPDSVEVLGANAIGNNTVLSSVNIPLSLQKAASWPSPFEGNPKLTHMTVPEGMTHLPAMLFSNMDSLQSVSLPSTLRSIGYEAFEYCDNLTSITLPKGLETIGEGAFQKSALRSITIPGLVTHLNADVLADCRNLASVTLPEGLVSIGRCAINSCPSLLSLHLPDSVRTMGANAIGNNSSLYSVNVPLSLQEVDSSVPPFYNCPQLKHMVVPDGMETLPDYLFDGMTSLTSVSLPASLRVIGSYAFSNTHLTSLSLPAQLELIGSYAFAGCKYIPSVHIPGTVSQVSRNAFDCNTSLSLLTIDEGVEVIGSYAFSGCNALLQVTLPDSIVELNDRAFGDCAALSEINIPLSLKTCDGFYSPFKGSPNLTSMTIPDGMTQIPAQLFLGATQVRELYVPASVQGVGSKAFNETNLSTVYTPVRGSYGAAYFARNFPNVEIVVVHENLCAVNFDSQGGSKVRTRYVDIGALVEKPVSPRREDHLFTGWYTDKDCSTPWDFSTDTAPSDGLTLYAGWDSNPPCIFEVNGGQATILAYVGDKTDITLPAEYDGMPVTRLAAGAIPAHVYSVGIPASITTVDSGAFAFAAKLNTITVNSENPIYRADSGVLYTRQNVLHTYPRARSAWTFAPAEGTLVIGEKAFTGVSNLRTLNLPGSVAELENSAVSGCSVLRDVVFVTDPLSIGAACFAGCPELRLGGPLDAPVLTGYASGHGLRYNDYELTFMDRGVKLGSIRARAGQLLDAPQEPTIPAYSFLGWSASNSASALWDFASGVMPQKDMTLYTVWKLDYTVTPVDGGVALSGYTGSCNPVPVPEQVDGLDVVSIAEDTFPDPTVTLQGNKGSVTHAFAQQTGMAFQPLSYTVTFSSNGGTQPAAQTRCATDPVAEPAVQRTGYVLRGWYTDAALTTLWDFASDAMPAADLTLYAGWNATDGAVEIPYTWQDNGTGLTITGYTGTGSDIVIPQTINGQTVSAVAPHAFQGKAALRKVTLPDSVTAIGAYAFADCRSLTAAVLPQGLTTLSEGLFAGCPHLKQLTLPAAVETISAYAFLNCAMLPAITLGQAVSAVDPTAFDGCSALTAIKVADGNRYFAHSEGVLFSADLSRLIRYPEGKGDTAYTVPDGVLTIGEGAMASSRIRSLTLPASLAAVSRNALKSSIGLHTVTFAPGSALSVIGANAFTGCVSLRSIVLPDALTVLARNAFSGCSLTSITVPSGTSVQTGAIPAADGLLITGTAGSDAERYANLNGIRFADPSLDVPVTGAVLPKTLTLLCGQTLPLTWQLTPADTTETAVSFSSSNTAIATVTSDGLVTGWSRGRAVITLRTADGTCTECTVIVQEANAIPESVALSRESAVLAAGVQLPLTATLTPLHAEPSLFWSTTDDTVAYVSNGCIMAVGEGSCTLTVTTLNGLTADCNVTVYPALDDDCATLPAALTIIGEEAFRGSSLTAVRLPGTVTAIDSLAFADCLSLTAVSIPAAVTAIAEDAFTGCGPLVIYGQEGTFAQQFAQANGFGFVIETVGE